jgi:hypothetical protein
MKNALFCTAHRHTTHEPTCVIVGTRPLGCYPVNRIIKVKMENKLARGFPSNKFGAQNLMWVYL